MKTFNELTEKELLSLTMGKNQWEFNNLGFLPRLAVCDGPLGLRRAKNLESWGGEIIPSIAYPSSQLSSMTWNKELIGEVASSIADDCIENNIDVLLGPGTNIKRIPQCGRNFEYYSEDPFLAGNYAYEFIKTLQSRNVGATLKHYAVNNTEICRLFENNNVDKKTLYEIYLKPFQLAAKAKPWLVMSSYNSVNGVRMSENKNLINVLRNEFGFDGAIVSDWDAGVNYTKTVLAGTNITMPFDASHFEETLKEVGNSLPLDVLKNTAKPVYDLFIKNEEVRNLRKVISSKEERLAVTRKVAEEGIVLLKNKNNILPLNQNTSVLVTGAPCFTYLSGGGSSQVNPSTPYLKLDEELKKLIKEVAYHVSVSEMHGEQSVLTDLEGCVEIAKNKDVSIIAVGNDSECEVEGRNRSKITLTKEQELTIKEISKVSKTIVLIYAGAAIDMSNWINDVDAIMFVGYGGSDINKVISNVLVGNINPSGKLSETFGKNINSYLTNKYLEPYNNITYKERLQVGYRYFLNHKNKILFPFGYGLSYSTFEYSELKVIKNNDSLLVTYKITNTSNRDGKEISQIYLKLQNGIKYELKGYSKDLIPAHENKTISVNIPLDELRIFDLKKDNWEAIKKTKVYVGASSIDIRLVGHTIKL